MTEPLRVLVVEHDPSDAELCLHALERAGFEVQGDVVDLPEQFAERVRTGVYDVVVADYSLPGWTGLDALELLRALGLDVPLILVTGTLGEERAVECLRRGVADYILKQNLAPLPVAVRRALEERRASRERPCSEDLIRKVTLAVDQSPVSVVITDTTGLIRYVNQRFEEVTGYAAEEVLGRTPRILKSGRTPDDVYRELWETIRNGQVWQGELLNRRKDGAVYWDALCIAPVRDTAGNITDFLAIQEDITERKQTEEQFRQAQKMEAVGRLAGGVAHDFNNLLTVITSYAEILLGDLAANDARREDVEQILKAATDAATLTGQLLVLGRQQVIAPRVVALEELVAGSAKMLKPLLGEDIELVTSLSQEPLTVTIDPGQLEQIIMNLAINARDAMPGGGRVVIETAKVDQGGQYAMLAMSDTGVGMDEQTRASIFEPFFTTKEVGRGTGLGLATVYGMVKQNGGLVRVESEPGRGASFKIYFPLSDQSAVRGSNSARQDASSLRSSG